MGWYFEIADRDRGLLETSEPIYSSKYEAEWAGYVRAKERPDYAIGELPNIGAKDEGGLRSASVIEPTITAKLEEQ